MKSPITIIGLGQMGSMLAYRLLRSGHKIRAVDSRKINEKVNNQIPWGWFRKFSLQSKSKKKLASNDFPISNIDNIINSNRGPMLLTSNKKESVYEWKEWIKNNPDTDSYILNSTESEKLFNIPSDYIKNGGTYVCDSRDKIIDFKLLNDYIWNYLENDKNCELIQECEIKNIKTNKNNIATHLDTNNGMIEIDKTIMCTGNQTSKLLNYSVPILEITLPFAFINNIPKQNYISIWNKHSSLTYFGDGSIKLGCGIQSSFDYKNINCKTVHFASMGLSGLSNININKSNEYLINKAINELKLIGINNIPKIESMLSCNVDLTPNLSPYIFFLPNANNILSISGFSGSAAMAIDNSFADLIIKSTFNTKLDEKLNGFSPNNNIINNWFPPKDKQTPLSSII